MPSNQSTRESSFLSDAEFDQLYPLRIQALARRHWTPLDIARRAARFLAAEKPASILDIGSGIGKFCLAAAHYEPGAFFYGVEQRSSLVEYAEHTQKLLRLENARFITGNFTQLNFKNYQHFYLYNPFYENLQGTEKIDQSIDYSGELFHYYNRFLRKQLDQKPAGTRLATYHSLEEEVPNDYLVVGTHQNDLLKFWIKV